MGRRSTVSRLPEDVRRWLERALVENNFSEFEVLKDMMAEKGYSLSRSAIHRHSQQIQRRFAAIRASTEAARLLTEGATDDQDARSEAIIALVQTELFDTIVRLQEAEDEEDQGARIKLLSTAARNIATLTRASVNLKKFQQDVRDKLSQKLAAIESEAKGPGSNLDLATVQRIARDVYGIFP